MSDSQIYLELSSDLQEIFDKNNLNLSQILVAANLDVDISHQLPFYQTTTDSQTRDLKTVIIASSLLIPSIGFTISKVMDTYYHRPIHITYEQLEEIREEGKVIKDNNGNVLMKLVVYQEILNTERNKEESFIGEFGKFVMRFNSIEKK